MELRLTYCMRVGFTVSSGWPGHDGPPAGLKSKCFMYNRQSAPRADSSGLRAPLVVAASVVGRIVSRHDRISAWVTAVDRRRWR